VTTGDDWWRRAVVYQLYIRSFADGDGDGLGDIAGIRAHLPYLRDLGVDAIWVNPWYPSPMADGGYDVADYRAIDPRFGTLADADGLIAEAHALGLRILADIVPNHTSERHAWFQAALANPPGSPERGRYHFRDGKGAAGSEAPNDWVSVFGGPAWTRIHDADGRPGQWYLHLFAPEQPDLDWANPEVREEFESILEFWFARGIDGFRVDVAHGLAKDGRFPDVGIRTVGATAGAPAPHPHWDRDEVHEIYAGWRRIADRHTGGRVFIGEVHVPDPERRARYLRGDELHTAFEFDVMRSPWDATQLRARIEATRTAMDAAGAPPTWVLSNHDEARHVTRYGRAYSGLPAPTRGVPAAVDLALGTRRARAAALLMLALPGSAYLYQGEELGLWEVEDIPDALLQDPIWIRTGHTERGRDGCRVPLPWSGKEPPFGFGPDGSVPWLPQPLAWRSFTPVAEDADPDSMLHLYRAALHIRREHPGLAGSGFQWIDDEAGPLHFERDAGLACLVNLSAAPIALPPGAGLVLASAPVIGGELPVDAAAWYVRQG
jgi:alpha-glucosidase